MTNSIKHHWPDTPDQTLSQLVGFIYNGGETKVIRQPLLLFSSVLQLLQIACRQLQHVCCYIWSFCTWQHSVALGRDGSHRSRNPRLSSLPSFHSPSTESERLKKFEGQSCGVTPKQSFSSLDRVKSIPLKWKWEREPRERQRWATKGERKGGGGEEWREGAREGEREKGRLGSGRNPKTCFNLLKLLYQQSGQNRVTRHARPPLFSILPLAHKGKC